MGLVLKARYTGGMGGIRLVGNENSFPGTLFGWFYPRLVFILVRRNVPLSALLNVGQCEHL